MKQCFWSPPYNLSLEHWLHTFLNILFLELSSTKADAKPRIMQAWSYRIANIKDILVREKVMDLSVELFLLLLDSYVERREVGGGKGGGKIQKNCGFRMCMLQDDVLIYAYSHKIQIKNEYKK